MQRLHVQPNKRRMMPSVNALRFPELSSIYISVIQCRTSERGIKVERWSAVCKDDVTEVCECAIKTSLSEKESRSTADVGICRTKSTLGTR